MSWWPKITRKRIIVTTTLSSLLLLNFHDRQKRNAYLQTFTQRAQQIAQQPLHATDQAPRRLVLYLSAASEQEGRSLFAFYEQAVKPIFDAAALDVEVVSAWEWYKDTASRVRNQLLSGETPSGFWKEVERSGGGYGRVALGRAAFKGVVLAEAEFAEAEWQRVQIEGAGKQAAKPVTAARSWWPWGGKTQQPLAEEDLMETEIGPESLAVPPIGFVPYNPPTSWYTRLVRWLFYQRKDIQVAGEAALAIAQGSLVPLSVLFPGDIRFRVEEHEYRVIEEDVVAASKEAEQDVSLKEKDTVEKVNVEKAEVAQDADADQTVQEKPLEVHEDRLPMEKEDSDIVSEPHGIQKPSTWDIGAEVFIPEHVLRFLTMYHGQDHEDDEHFDESAEIEKKE